MNAATQAQLKKINREFYHSEAGSFSATRQQPWPGWVKLTDQYLDQKKSLLVLDLGCGNGRFGQFLAESGLTVDYTGVDESMSLLEEAKLNVSPLPNPQLIHASIETWVNRNSIKPMYDLVVLFGVLHHFPGIQERIKLIQAATQLSSNLTAVSFWQFAKFDRFKKRIVSWSTYNRTADTPVEIGQLDPEDYLLLFNHSRSLRYCHSFTHTEIESIKSQISSSTASEYRSDGKDNYNYYVIFQK